MYPTSFPESNTVLDKPDSLTHDQCEALSAWIGALENGCKVTISCWKVSKEELEEINKTGKVWIVVLGHGQPPLCPVGVSPFHRVEGIVENQAYDK